MQNTVFTAVSMSVTAAALALIAAASAHAAPPVVKEEPPKGTVRIGEVVYVDDGSCPAGELKKIVGGNQQTGRKRQVECVKRPQGM